MPDIDIKRDHNLGLRAARAAADKMVAHLGERFGLVGEWQGNTLAFNRPGVAGSLAIEEKSLRLTVSLGFLLKAIRPSIERAVHEELDTLFASEAGVGPRSKKAAARPKKGD